MWTLNRYMYHDPANAKTPSGDIIKFGSGIFYTTAAAKRSDGRFGSLGQGLKPVWIFLDDQQVTRKYDVYFDLRKRQFSWLALCR